MAEIRNTNTIKEALDTFGLDGQSIPKKSSDTIVATVETNPKIINSEVQCTQLSRSTSSSTSTLMTTSATKRTFIIGYSSVYYCTATCDHATAAINVTYVPKGQASADTLFVNPVITLTQHSYFFTETFRNPIEVQPSTPIQASADTYTAGTRMHFVSLKYIEVDEI